ncbi:ATP-binding protein [Helicobacter monodelphidis]|uniref:argininosuccinate synthase domain-containing protein n=1 Tax=Helicobacter sp. 15-1451 TaxID=2004995 RepID=UPI000DCB027A|nr:argininosuccinate synthase domain-containing protein [Helicobacter sp. 15-1451]RAX57621.1 ATP-binding protein [Helicobacter sp. 15-1451]
MKALALFSGGLDSLLAMKLIKDQGIKVVALNFNIGFGAKKDKREFLENATKQIDVELRLIDIREQFFDEILFNPKYGYGKYFNPCIDCHANMFRQAFSLLEEEGASFVISGEVLGQRPKSQRKEALFQVNHLVGDKIGIDEGLILRPMCAKLLPMSTPEKMGWVDREKLLDISGRGRERQLKMVQDLGLKYYEKPGGGCLLTDISVAKRLKDITARRKAVRGDREISLYGRYFILPDGGRCVISRNEEENQKLNIEHEKMQQIRIKEESWLGPVGLVDSESSMRDKGLAASLMLLYGKSQLREYPLQIGEANFFVVPFDSKQKAQEMMI